MSVRVVLISVSVAVVVMLGASCVRSGQTGESRDPSAAPRSVAAEKGDLGAALAAAGVDPARLPFRLGALDGRAFCGSDVRAQGESQQSPAARCFLDRHIAELDGFYVTTYPTTEGDPMTTVFVTGRDGRVATFTDASRDVHGNGGWSRSDGRRVAARASFGATSIELVDPSYGDVEPDASLPELVGEVLPGWFEDRAPLRWCGMDVRVEDLNLEARQCLRDAVEVGDPVEYVVGQTGDEGERKITWFRVLGPGSFEVFERHLPRGPPMDGSEPAWRRLHCSRIDFLLAPGSQVDLLPLADDPVGCS